MKILLSYILVFTTLINYAQTKTDTNYLILRIDQVYDNTKFNNYYIIKAEIGCDAAGDIYKLKEYINKKNFKNIDAVFYTDKTDSLKALYNYFYSSTEILNYLSEKGFTLVTIYNDIFSGDKNVSLPNGDLVPITTVGSRPVFCFKK